MLPTEESIIDHPDKGFNSLLFRGIDPGRAELYKLCSQKQIGISVMKMLAGGKLISAEQTPFSKPLTVPQCINYALSRPDVCSVLIRCKTPDEATQAMAYFDSTDEQKDYVELLQAHR